jgi:hypothetical protein
MGRPLWQEDGSVVNSSCWASPEKYFSGSEYSGIHDHILLSQFWESHNPVGQVPVPQEQGGPIIPQAMRFVQISFARTNQDERKRTTWNTQQWIKCTELCSQMLKLRSYLRNTDISEEDNIKMDIKWMIIDNVNYFHISWVRVQGPVESHCKHKENSDSITGT